jgi:hypothetical protein
MIISFGSDAVDIGFEIRQKLFYRNRGGTSRRAAVHDPPSASARSPSDDAAVIKKMFHVDDGLRFHD